MNESDDVVEEYRKLNKRIQKNELSEKEFFEWLAFNDKKFKSNDYYAKSINGFISDIGSDLSSENVLKCAISRMRKIFAQSTDKYSFDIGNTHLRLGQLQRKSKDTFHTLIESNEFQNAAKAFLNISANDKDYFLRSRTNYSNILKSYGRLYEALLTYEEILKIDPAFGVALTNQATGWLYYIDLYPSEYKPIGLLKNAYKSLHKALKDKRLVQIGGKGIVEFIQDKIKQIEENITVSQLKSIKIKSPPNTITSYQRFCLSQNLYLNFDLGHYYDKESLRDSLFPHLIESIDEEESLQSPGMSKKTYYTFQIFNQILEDFTTARLLYFEGLNNSLRKYDHDVNFIYTFDYTRHSHSYGKIKTSFTSLYNCLDKIAHLIRFYFKNVDTSGKLYFNWFVSREYKNIIKNESNYQLLALYSLALDFEKDQPLHSLRLLRNRLTHSFVNITELRLPENEHEISPKNLNAMWLNLCQKVKAALLYSILAIEPNDKSNSLNWPLLATFQKEIY